MRGDTHLGRCAAQNADGKPCRSERGLYSLYCNEHSESPVDLYLISKNGMFYRPNAQGYTSSVFEAGRFTLHEAIQHSHPNGPDGPRDGISFTVAPPKDAARRPFQDKVGDWMLLCFGEEIAEDRLERGDRFIEEALELAQTVPGFTAERAHALVDYVFSRPTGEQFQEVGGVMVTLAALCNTFGLSIEIEASRELARVWTKVDAIRAKQAAKPTGSALPVAKP